MGQISGTDLSLSKDDFTDEKKTSNAGAKALKRELFAIDPYPSFPQSVERESSIDGQYNALDSRFHGNDNFCRSLYG